MNKPVIFLFTLFLLAGCSIGGLPDVTPATQGQPAVYKTATVTKEQAISPALSLTEAPAPSETQVTPETTISPVASQTAGAPVMTQSSGPLTVQLFSEADVAVDAPKYLVSGRAPAGTVLSINDEIILVDPSQAFAVWVPLEEGPNLIEIVASDDAGDEVDFMITVSYNSQP